MVAQSVGFQTRTPAGKKIVLPLKPQVQRGSALGIIVTNFSEIFELALAFVAHHAAACRNKENRTAALRLCGKNRLR